MQIPLINFALFTQGDVTDKRKVVDQIYTACHEIGFMYLQNAGIPPSLLKQLLVEAKQFFNLPASLKEQVARSDKTNCGYVGFEEERLDPKNPGDLKEAFNMGVQVVWPAEPEEFRQVVSEFYRLSTTVVAPNILRAFAIALQLSEDFFDDKHGQNYFLRLLHYPPVNQAPEPGQLRAGEHTDYGSITLLLQDEVEGLEVRTRDGEWIAAPAIPDTIVVNVGDIMQRWTNDQLSSTPHRVIVPTGLDAARSRYSVALFCDPNPEVEIACLTSECLARYQPILTKDYLASRLAATY